MFGTLTKNASLHFATITGPPGAGFLSLGFSRLFTHLHEKRATRCFLSFCPSSETPSVPKSTSSLTSSEQSQKETRISSPAAWWTDSRALFSLSYCFLKSCIRRRRFGFNLPQLLGLGLILRVSLPTKKYGWGPAEWSRFR